MIAAFTATALCLWGACQPPEPSIKRPELRVLWTYPLRSHSFGSAAVADVDNDGRLDVAFATYFGDAGVHVLRGFDGKEIWSYHDPNPQRDDCYDASVRFAEVTGDNRLDLIVPCSSGCRVLCFDAESGKPNWNQYLGDGDCIDTPPWIGDCDGSGKPSVVVGTFKSRMFVLRGVDGTIARTLNIAPSGAVQSCPVVIDLNFDGVPDYVGAVFGKTDRGVYAINGKDGSLLWHRKTGDSIYHGPAVGMLPGPHGKPGIRLISSCYDGGIYAINQDGSECWTLKTGERYIMSPVTLADLDGDGVSEVLTASDRIVCADADGSIRWTRPIAHGRGRGYETVSRGVVIADLDGDGAPDIPWLTSRGLFRAINAAGEVIYEYDAGPLLAGGAQGRDPSDGSHSPVVADLDGDGLLDVFFVIGGAGEKRKGANADRYGLAVCLTGFAGRASATNSWTTMRHDNQNTGNSATTVK